MTNETKQMGSVPVGWVYKEYVWATGLGGYVWREKIEREAPDLDASSIKDLTPIYAEQPAPVAVVLPERKPLPDLMLATYHEAAGWNACLDELTRLNPIKQ